MKEQLALARIRAFTLLLRCREAGMSREEAAHFLEILKIISRNT